MADCAPAYPDGPSQPRPHDDPRIHHKTRKYAPRTGQRIWVAPDQLQQAPLELRFGRADSGRVVGGDWDRDQVEILSFWKMKAAVQHWRDGVPWEETGIYDHMLETIKLRGSKVDGCDDMDDIVDRYERLDRLFEHVRRSGRLATSAELGRLPARCEVNGIYVHVDRNARPLFGSGGFHRLAIAKVLELPVVPAQLGVVHTIALPNWQRLKERQQPEGATYTGPARRQLP